MTALKFIICLCLTTLLLNILPVSCLGTFYLPEETCKYRYEGNISAINCRDYIYCSEGKYTSLHTCPAGMLFNAVYNACELYWPQIRCGGNMLQQCRDDPNCPRFYQMDPENCGAYSYCSNGEYLTLKCDEGYRYDARKLGCVPAAERDCAVGTVCQFVPNTQFVMDPENNNTYYECSGGFNYQLSCPEGFWYNAKIQKCDDNHNVAPGSIYPLPDNETKCKNVLASGGASDDQTCLGYHNCMDPFYGEWFKCNKGQHFNRFEGFMCSEPKDTVCPYDRCGNSEKQFMATVGCESYVVCENEMTVHTKSCAAINSRFPYFDEVLGACVDKKPNYAICNSN